MTIEGIDYEFLKAQENANDNFKPAYVDGPHLPPTVGYGHALNYDKENSAKLFAFFNNPGIPHEKKKEKAIELLHKDVEKVWKTASKFDIWNSLDSKMKTGLISFGLNTGIGTLAAGLRGVKSATPKDIEGLAAFMLRHEGSGRNHQGLIDRRQRELQYMLSDQGQGQGQGQGRRTAEDSNFFKTIKSLLPPPEAGMQSSFLPLNTPQTLNLFGPLLSKQGPALNQILSGKYALSRLQMASLLSKGNR